MVTLYPPGSYQPSTFHFIANVAGRITTNHNQNIIAGLANSSDTNITVSLDILLTVHHCIIYSLFPTWYTAFLSMYNICYPLFSTCFRPHRPIIRRSKLYMQPMVLSPSAVVFVVRPHDKDICRGGEYHRLHVQFRPPDDGPVRPEKRRGRKIADIVRRQKSSVSSWE